MPQLTATEVKAAGPGKHHDGQGLHLRVTDTGSKSWVLRITVDGRRREIGLGSWPEVSLVDARKKALEHRAAIAEGRDPVAEKRRTTIPVFRDAAKAVHEANRPRWRSEQHAIKWWRSLENHVFDEIGDMRVDRITQTDVLRILTPIWTTRPEAARRTRQRIRRLVNGENSVSNRLPVRALQLHAITTTTVVIHLLNSHLPLVRKHCLHETHPTRTRLNRTSTAPPGKKPPLQ